MHGESLIRTDCNLSNLTGFSMFIFSLGSVKRFSFFYGLMAFLQTFTRGNHENIIKFQQ